jgi:DNA-binding transcriptional LysR family regulator
MQFHQIKAFVAVADARNVTGAAKQLHLAQSSVSERLSALEDLLGPALFERSPRGFALTTAGEALLPRARAILNAVEDARGAVDAIAGEISGELRIGSLETLATVILAPRLAAFSGAFPKVTPIVSVGGSGALLAKIVSGALDASLLFEGFSEAPDLACRTIGSSPIVLISSIDRPRTDVREADLISNERFVVTPRGCIFRRLFDRLVGTDHAPRIIAEVESLATVQAMVAAGAGCAVVPALSVDHPGVVAVDWPRDASPLAIKLVWCRRRKQRPPLRAFLENIRGSDKPVPSFDMKNRSGGEAVAEHKLESVGNVVGYSHSANG